MQAVTLQRINYNENQTLGILATIQPDGNIFVARTLELPWDKNITDVSCIPDGRYICKWTRSTRLSLILGKDVYTYEVTGVIGRSGIRIHSANYVHQLKGCIALGSAFKDINFDSRLDVIHSGDTMREFNMLMNGRDFILEIEHAPL